MTIATFLRVTFPALAALSISIQNVSSFQAVPPASPGAGANFAGNVGPSFKNSQSVKPLSSASNTPEITSDILAMASAAQTKSTSTIRSRNANSASKPISAQASSQPDLVPPAVQAEGPIINAKFEVGPFDLHRRYRSMEGPYLNKRVRIGDLIASIKVVAPESMIVFIEGKDPNALGALPSMNATGPTSDGGLEGVVSGDRSKRELYWLKGVKIQVLDENDKPLDSGEFICHLNVDVDPKIRKTDFPEMEDSPSSRVITLTQGQTEFNFPPGFGVPVASKENWMFTFQAANRTSDKHRRVKQLLTLSLIKDSELVEPIKALSWFAPYIKVVVDRDTPEAAEAEHKMGPGCLGTVSGVTAPNSVPGAILTDSLGRRLSGHWVVPPGVHAYASPINQEWDPGFASKKRRIHAVWSHVHPLCTEVSLGECGSADTPDLFKVSVQTKTEGGLELKHIDNIISKEGLVMQPGKQYQVKAKYDNTTGKPQDSMIVIGVFYADEKFARPDWVLSDKNEAYCGVTASGDKTCSKSRK